MATAELLHGVRRQKCAGLRRTFAGFTERACGAVDAALHAGRLRAMCVRELACLDCGLAQRFSEAIPHTLTAQAGAELAGLIALAPGDGAAWHLSGQGVAPGGRVAELGPWDGPQPRFAVPLVNAGACAALPFTAACESADRVVMGSSWFDDWPRRAWSLGLLAHAIDTAVSAPKSCAQDCARRLPDRTRVRQVDAC